MLESYHNTVLGYAPKRTPYEWEYLIHHAYKQLTYCFHFRDDSYRCRIMLAGLDHNKHINRPLKKDEGSLVIYHRVWRKRTKHWDVIPIKVNKDYAYIPELISKILLKHTNSTRPIRNLKRKERAATITPVAPPKTKELIDIKKSRFHLDWITLLNDWMSDHDEW